MIFIGHGPAFWAEISTLKDPDDRYGYPSYPIIKEGRIAELMRLYDNLWVDLSANSGKNALMRDKDYSIKFLNEFNDRIMYGTDICYYKQVLTTNEFLIELKDKKHLTESAFLNIAYKNAYRLLGINQ